MVLTVCTIPTQQCGNRHIDVPALDSRFATSRSSDSSCREKTPLDNDYRYRQYVTTTVVNLNGSRVRSMAEQRISDAEWDVMQVIWGKSCVTAADVIDSLAETKGWNHRTIRTLLSRLLEKGVLSYEVAGNRYVYRAAVTRRQCVRKEGRSFVEKVFGGDVGALLVHFAKESSVGPEDLAALRAILDQKYEGDSESKFTGGN